MIALIQRVSEAGVRVDGAAIAGINGGLLVLLGVEQQDTEIQASRLAERVLAYRVFADENGRMNLNVSQVDGQLLVVPQFTLAADTNSGNRPSFSPAASPGSGRALFEYFVAAIRQRYPAVVTGEFGAHMEVSLVNDGPVTFWLRVAAVVGAN